MDYSLSDLDIKTYLGHMVKIITYKELYKYQSIDQLLSPYDVVVILYEVKPNNGHWTILFRRNSKVIEFFDSYGLEVDDELKLINNKYRNQLKENFNYLTQLIYDSPYELEYNNYKFQKLDHKINTCGRWILLRYTNKHLNIDDFYEEIIKLSKKLKITPDLLVSRLIKIN